MRRTRTHLIALMVALLAGGALARSARAAAATDDLCFTSVMIGIADTRGDRVVIAGEPVGPGISNLGEDCPGGVSTTILRPDGMRLRVDLPNRFDRPPWVGYVGPFSFPVDAPSGVWRFADVTVGAQTRPATGTFVVERAIAISLDPVPTVTAPAAQTVTGTVRTWNTAGASVPAGSGVPVELRTVLGTSLGTAVTNAAGRFTVRTRLVHNNSLEAHSPGVPARFLFRGESNPTQVLVRAALLSWSASTTGVVNRWWRFDGRTAPGGLYTRLMFWTGDHFEAGLSFGQSAADGTFTRWWKPTAAGTYRVRGEVSGNLNAGLPINRDLTVVVRSLQTNPTYLDGVTGSTTGGVVRLGSPISTFGHLRVRHTNGTVGPFSGQRVDVQIRPLATGAWSYAGSTTTSATGYFYKKWQMPFTEDTEVRVVFDSPYETIRSTLLGLGVIDVVR